MTDAPEAKRMSAEELAELSLAWIESERAYPDVDTDFPVGAQARAQWRDTRKVLADAAPRLLAEIAALRASLISIQAQLTARSKTMLLARDILMGIRDELDDEGDRVYFGSTNHAEMLIELAEDLDGWVWDSIIRDAKKRDYIGELAALHTKLAAERERCAKIAESATHPTGHDRATYEAWRDNIAAAIRRGEE